MKYKSIYSIICENVNSEGKLPRDFSLPFNETPPNKISFMPGAKEGIGIFHFGIEHHKKVPEKIVKLLKRDWKNGSTNSQSKIAEFLHVYGTLSVIDPVLDLILKDRNEIDVKNMFDYAFQLAFESSDEELVKLGIGLFGLLDLSEQQEIINKLLILALYEEFTLYVAVAVLKCKNGNDILFKIAQKVDGWGKIHTVKRMEPESDEIREWILRKGCANSVMDSYLGLECAIKGDLIGALRRDYIDDELFEGISIIIDAMLDEGPVEGISAYEHAEEALRRYLHIASVRAVTVMQFWRILNLQNWLKDAEIADRDELQKICDSIVSKESWREKISDVLKNPEDEQFFYAASAANRLNMDVSELVYRAIRHNPVKNCGYLYIAYKNHEYANELTKIYEKILPLDDMATGMGDFLFADRLTQEHNCLDLVLQELRNYPKMGERLVLTALKSPVVRERNGACRVMEEWCSKLNQDLSAISPDLFSALKEVADIEVDADIRENMKKLLKV